MSPPRWWTKERVEEFIEILKSSATVEEAERKAATKWNRRFSRSSYQRPVKQLAGATASHFLGGNPYAKDKGEPAEAALSTRIRQLQSEIDELRSQAAGEAVIKRLIHGALKRDPAPPRWLSRPKLGQYKHGTPTLFLSDIHHGEVVHPNQVNGANAFDMKISARRLERVVDKTCNLLTGALSRTTYPGIVCALGGDLVSGTIHDELRETNEGTIFQQTLSLLDLMIAVVTRLHDEFGQVYLPCVVGNHGRSTKKPQAKNRNETNFEWLLYQLLSRHFAKENGIVFHIAGGIDMTYAVYGVRYLLTHGDRFRGGTGIAGPATPWALGDKKLRAQMDALSAWTKKNHSYDTLIFGHFHTLAMGIGQSYICNGSLKGWDEYAKAGNFRYEPPQQCLWLTHPNHRITFVAPVRADEPSDVADAPPWVSFPQEIESA